MISVLMGVHRMDAYVFPAIDSMLAQRNVEFELIVVANGATCGEISRAVTAHYPGDTRIRVFETPVGQLAHALNVGLSVAKYDLIARMDADDVSHGDRLARQIRFLRESESDIVGCSIRLIDSSGEKIGVRRVPRGKSIARQLPFRNCFVHPTIIARKQVLLDARGYSGGFNCEDYDLWLRLRRQGVRWDNMDEFLVDYRIHDAASQRRLLGYAEFTGFLVRELLLTKNPIWAVAGVVAFVKALLRSR